MFKLSLKLILALSLFISISQNSVADNYPKREMRSVWLATAWGLDWPASKGVGSDYEASQKAEMTQILDELKENNFNAVFFQVRSRSDAMYKSSYEPWSSDLVSTRGNTPTYDPLEWIVAECHKRGMECHAYINPFRFWTVTTYSPLPSTAQDLEVINAGWLLSYNDYYFLDPSNSAVRTRIKNVCEEIVRNYDVDGIVFDDYFYANSLPEGGDYDYDTWKNSGTTLSQADWRRENINTVVKLIYDMIQGTKPYVKFGIAPAGVAKASAATYGISTTDISLASDWQYDQIYSDPLAWLNAGTIDYISPQIYWGCEYTLPHNQFDVLNKWWAGVAEHFNRHYYPSIDLKGSGSNKITSSSVASTTSTDYTVIQTTFDEYVNEVKYSREDCAFNSPGSVFFCTDYVTSTTNSAFAPYLKSNIYQNKAITPAINWKSTTNPGKPQNLAYTSGTLNWDASVMDATFNTGMRYAVYAIPLTVNPVEAASSVHTTDGGFKSEYLLDITYTNTFDVSSYSSDTYWYAVTIVDRYGNEWEASTINAPASIPVTVALSSPATGNTISTTSEVFSWTGDIDASFTFEISDNTDFSNIVFTQTTNNYSVTVSAGIFEENKTYYWRVTAKKTGYVNSTTEAWSFITPTLPTFTFALTSPTDGATINNQTQAFSWEAVENGSYVIEIATEPTFASPTISAATTSNSYNLSTNDLNGSSTYYWRVIASCDGYKNATSETRTFITPEEITWTKPILYCPYDESSLSSDISFVASKSYVETGDIIEYGDAYYLEISKTDDFSELYFSGYTNWQDETSSDGTIWLQYTLPISYFANGTYYWRVRATKSGWKDGVSDSRKFSITGQSDTPGSSETTYKLVRENHEYAHKSYMINGVLYRYTLTNLWIRTDELENGLGQTETSSNYRGFCARSAKYGDQNGKDILWVIGRNGSVGFLDKYDASTGEYIGKLSLSGNYATNYSPCNDVFLDASGNLCIMNLTLGTSANAANNTIQIATVDPLTGVATSRFSQVVSERIDHAHIYGDITSGEAYIYAVSPSSTVYRWELNNGEVVDAQTQSISSFYPTAQTAFGTAPRIYPYSDEYFYVDGSYTSFTLYKWGLASPYASFATSTANAPSGNQANGGTFFFHDNRHYLVYVSSSFENKDTDVANYKFAVATATEHTDWSNFQHQWTIPTANIGDVKNSGGDYGALVDYLQYDAFSGLAKTSDSGYDLTKIFLYVPGNGMAAYALTQHIVTGDEAITIEDIEIAVDGQEITFGCDVDDAQLYTLSGIMIGAIENSSSIEKPTIKGVYLLRVTVGDTTATYKIII